ncbi:HAMP domain-containing sensor histidine kinase [Paucibacter sp. APW11]|uniref:histidine kinase n=1 Tax=Roseateles aquae TaxID=3077235 RepID=A0ABU3PHL1_9BURK|nr:HAMP domain-containing sensor histidine kinase [Paucibacter sp. APW11]MDT9002065.1 HAMP domain-containing sensor histidine kinase [Paucibacter sp. APW11]
MPQWLQPTLTRRVVGALLLAIFLFAVLILVEDQMDLQQTMSTDPGIGQFGREIAVGLDVIDDAALAARVLDAHLQHVNRLRARQALSPGPLLAHLVDHAGATVYPSALAFNIGKIGNGEQQIAGKAYWTYRQDGARWSLRMAEPALSRTQLLSFASWALGKQLMLAFPLMLLPLWLAVYTGLAPLRRFARRLHQLDPKHDLAPLQADLRYSELRPVGQAFDVLLDRLRQRRARERAFVHEAAHELRTPLAVVATQAHALMKAPDDTARASAASALNAAIARSAHLSSQLLDLASLDNEQPSVPTTLDLTGFCASRLAEQSALARERGISLALDAPEHLHACVDAVALHSVLQNLLDNALRYVNRGGHVEVTLGSGADGLTLSVADDGPGIAAEDHPMVFERFWRGVGHEVPGSGLGLAIVARAAERMGGRICIGDGLARPGGCGARFELQLPLLGIPSGTALNNGSVAISADQEST